MRTPSRGPPACAGRARPLEQASSSRRLNSGAGGELVPEAAAYRHHRPSTRREPDHQHRRPGLAWRNQCSQAHRGRPRAASWCGHRGCRYPGASFEADVDQDAAGAAWRRSSPAATTSLGRRAASRSRSIAAHTEVVEHRPPGTAIHARRSRSHQPHSFPEKIRPSRSTAVTPAPPACRNACSGSRGAGGSAREQSQLVGTVREHLIPARVSGIHRDQGNQLIDANELSLQQQAPSPAAPTSRPPRFPADHIGPGRPVCR